MKWEWKGSEDSEAGLLEVEFDTGKVNIALPNFREARYLIGVIDDAISAAEHRGSMQAVARYENLGKQIKVGE